MEVEEAKRRARKGPLLLMARRLFAIVITLVSTITVARILSPEDYGLANMSTVLLAFAQIFRDFGLTNAVLRKGTISQAEMSLIFWFNAAMTCVLTVIIAAISPFVGEFYGEPLVTTIILVSLIGFLLRGLSQQHMSLINRELRFGTLAVVDGVSLLLGFVVTLGMALTGWNVWAIVIGNLVQLVIGSIAFVALSGWRPDWPRRHEEMRSLLIFGANTSIYSISVFFGNNIASIAIGYFLGPAPLGQFNRAQALYNMPNANLIQPITQATMPLLTQLRPYPDEYREAYLGLVRRLCAFLIPISVMFAMVATTLVRALLGAQWTEAGYVLAALAPALASAGLGYAAGDLFITQDRSTALRKLGLIDMVIRVGAVLIGCQFGVVGAALGFTIASYFVVLLRVYVAGRSGSVTTLAQIKSVLPGVPMGIGAAAGALIARGLLSYVAMPDLPRAVALIAASALGALIAGLLVAGSRRVLGELADTFGLHQLRRFGQKAATTVLRRG